ncbi:MAG: DDE-type integrase/transposase/recombinase [Candidatus Omnitrophica bacterium]|nr:DDE-type integrase/transposase/recombinase [Candidatus Omnitrophota bacterium]
MSERRVLIKHSAKSYQKAGKKEKMSILDEFVKATGYNRVHAARVLRGHGRSHHFRNGVKVKAEAAGCFRRGRGRVYGSEVEEPLTKIWECLDYVCGKRLAPAIPAALESLERHGEIVVDEETRGKLLKMSASTIDRLLKAEREKYALRGRSGTKPGTLLKSQIPVRTFADWDEEKAGFLEIDLVGHDGGSSQGDFLQTLDVTDVHTGWSEQRAVLNKAQKWVFEALLEIRDLLPFPLLGIDSDNGSEFINHHLRDYCEEEKITFTRSRSHRKNDTCYVEQKNYSIVRQTVGYGRFQGSKSVRKLNELYDWIRLRTNFFQPSMKLIEKRREGSRVYKRYDRPQTPYQRLMGSDDVSQEIKQQLEDQFQALNLAALNREIRMIQQQLNRLLCPVGDRLRKAG